MIRKTQTNVMILVPIHTVGVTVDGAIGIHQPSETSLLVTPFRPNPFRDIDLMDHFVALYQPQHLQVLNQRAA